MTDDNVSKLTIYAEGFVEERQIQRLKDKLSHDVWNEAIEAAAKIVDQANRDGPYQAIVSAKRIRELKLKGMVRK